MKINHCLNDRFIIGLKFMSVYQPQAALTVEEEEEEDDDDDDENFDASKYDLSDSEVRFYTNSS